MKPPTEDQPVANPKAARIWGATRPVAVLFLIAGALYYVSMGAYFAFFIGARLTYSVPAARAFDAAGTLFLLPGRLVLWKVPAYITLFPSVIVPVNTGAWFTLLFLGLLIHQRFGGGSKGPPR